MARPLEGMTAIELGGVLAAPYCGLLLGDLGAEVIKVEPPAGDDSRGYVPTYPGTDLSAFNVAANRGKRSICLDLKKPAAVAALLRLAKRADIVVENFRHGVAERLGVDYAAVAALNPAIVYCSITGFGHVGPRAREPAMDLLMQAFSGQMGLIGHGDGPPARIGSSMMDITAALYAAFGIVAAILERARTGRGAHVRTSLLECQNAVLSYWWPTMQATGKPPGRMGCGHPALTPYQAFRAKDGDVVVAVLTDRMFAGAARAIGRPELAKDPRFRRNIDRLRHREEIVAIFAEAIAQRSIDEIIAAMRAEDVPATPVNSLADLRADPQMQALDGLVRIDQPRVGPVELPQTPLWFDETRTARYAPAPALGADGRRILTEAGFTDNEIDRLVSEGALLRTAASGPPGDGTS